MYYSSTIEPVTAINPPYLMRRAFRGLIISRPFSTLLWSSSVSIFGLYNPQLQHPMASFKCARRSANYCCGGGKQMWRLKSYFDYYFSFIPSSITPRLCQAQAPHFSNLICDIHSNKNELYALSSNKQSWEEKPRLLCRGMR